jgi:NAD(P)-dependent dehydrogenase (short-subunit alcohol dehydrogenase family)
MANEKSGVDRRVFLGGMAMAAGAASLLGTACSDVKQQAAAPAAPATPPAPAPMQDVEGKVAFITGGSSGIGLGQAHVFHRAGMKVVIGYIRDDQIGPALDGFADGKDRLHAIKVNVVDRAAMKAAADEIEARFGKIHLVSNNAGIGPLTRLLDTLPRDFDQTIAINLTGVYNGIHEFVPRIMKHGEGGHVLATSSMSGILPTEGGGAGAYTASKFGVTGMMEILRSELDAAKANIGASVYCPGLVATNIYELQKNLNAAFDEKTAQPADAAANTEMIKQIIGAGMDPMEAAEIVLAGVRNNDLFILSHPEFRDGLQERMDALMASLPGTSAPAERMAQEGVTMHNSLYLRETEKLRARKG